MEFYWVTPEGKFVYTNKTLRDRLGYSEDELRGMHVWDIDRSYSEEDREEFWEKLKEEKTWTFESKYETKSGEVYPVEVTSHHIEYGEGDEYEFALAKEIPKRKEAKEDLKQYKKAVEGSEDLMAAVDDNYNYLFANEAFLDYHEFDREEVIGHSAEEVVGEDEFKKSVKPYVDKCLEGESVNYEMTHQFPDIGKTHLDIWYYPLRREGEIQGAVATMRDVTDRMETEERKDFLYTLLREDLGSKYQTIQGYMELLEEEVDLSDEHREYLRKAIRAGQEADEILALAKKLEEIEETEWEGEKDLVKVLKHVLDDISDLVEREEIEIEENYPEDIPKVKGDYSLNTLFTQLLVTRSQLGECSKVELDTREREEDVLVRIEDDGEPLPENIKNLLTGELYTGETTGAGGVRYYMIRQIAEHNNAKIEVQGSEIGGSRFGIYLPKA